jgi:hypothetical protein
MDLDTLQHFRMLISLANSLPHGERSKPITTIFEGPIQLYQLFQSIEFRGARVPGFWLIAKKCKQVTIVRAHTFFLLATITAMSVSLKLSQKKTSKHCTPTKQQLQDASTIISFPSTHRTGEWNMFWTIWKHIETYIWLTWIVRL